MWALLRIGLPIFWPPCPFHAKCGLRSRADSKRMRQGGISVICEPASGGGRSDGAHLWLCDPDTVYPSHAFLPNAYLLLYFWGFLLVAWRVEKDKMCQRQKQHNGSLQKSLAPAKDTKFSLLYECIYIRQGQNPQHGIPNAAAPVA